MKKFFKKVSDFINKTLCKIFGHNYTCCNKFYKRCKKCKVGKFINDGKSEN